MRNNASSVRDIHAPENPDGLPVRVLTTCALLFGTEQGANEVKPVPGPGHNMDIGSWLARSRAFAALGTHLIPASPFSASLVASMGGVDGVNSLSEPPPAAVRPYRLVVFALRSTQAGCRGRCRTILRRHTAGLDVTADTGAPHTIEDCPGYMCRIRRRAAAVPAAAAESVAAVEDVPAAALPSRSSVTSD